MFFKTHIIIALFFVLVFFQQVYNPLIFLSVTFIATILPDIDNRFSKIGHYKISRIFNFFIKHRGITHSFTFLVLLSFFILLFFKNFLLPFVLGYSLHLFLDSLTLSGINPFYPIKLRIKGKIKTGGIIESLIFLFFLLGDLFLAFTRFYPIL
jgi:membrane-bound metal-dependent hydrolase YbcI (DUF457 family)